METSTQEKVTETPTPTLLSDTSPLVSCRPLLRGPLLEPPVLSQADIYKKAPRPGQQSSSPRRTRENSHSQSSSSKLRPSHVELLGNYGTNDDILEQLKGEKETRCSALEPLISAVLATNPTYELSGLDLVSTRTTIQRIFQHVSEPASESSASHGAPKQTTLKFYIELLQPQCTKQHISGKSGSGVSGTVAIFPDSDPWAEPSNTPRTEGEIESTRSFLEYHGLTHDGTGGSGKAITYELGGMKCLVGYDCKGILVTTTSGEQEMNKQQAGGDKKRDISLVVKKKTKPRSPEAIREIVARPRGKGRELPRVRSDDFKNLEVDDDDVIAKLDDDPEKLEELRSTMERTGLHPHPGYGIQDNDEELARSSSSRQRAGSASSISSTSSVYSQTSLRSIASSLSSVSSVPGYLPYDQDRKLQLAPGAHNDFRNLKISSLLPIVTSESLPKMSFDAPFSQIRFNPSTIPRLLQDSVYTAEETDSMPMQYKSTVKYSVTLAAWEREHCEAVKGLIVVLRKIRVAAEKAGGKCKIVVEKDGKVRCFKVKQDKGSVFSEAIIAGWK